MSVYFIFNYVCGVIYRIGQVVFKSFFCTYIDDGCNFAHGQTDKPWADGVWASRWYTTPHALF